MSNNRPFAVAATRAGNTGVPLDLLSPRVASGGVNAGTSSAYIVLHHVRVANVTTTPGAVVSLYKGASGAQAAGTEIICSGKTFAADEELNWYGEIRVDAGEYIVLMVTGGAMVVAVQLEGEMGVAG